MENSITFSCLPYFFYFSTSILEGVVDVRWIRKTEDEKKENSKVSGKVI